ncbi:MAG TPA: iron-sulfur cluster repair di-iron protein [Pyrinomonadaceae bacterium]|nr:iron-sulfur cluster repair di-iron protein [Pyrinomonadaceae bacterium]
MISSGTTVREVALQVPEATRLFEKLNIDYCCGGNRALSDACASAGVQTEDVLRMLDEVAQPTAARPTTPDFQQLPLPELISHILDTHHVFTKAEMTRLEALFAKVISVHGQNHPDLKEAGRVFERMCADLTPHMFKEERVLFPYMMTVSRAAANNGEAPFAPFGTVGNPVRMMMLEHDVVGSLLREMRKLTSDYTPPPDACISYQTLCQALEAFEKDLHQHIHLENNILFPRAIEMEQQLNS